MTDSLREPVLFVGEIDEDINLSLPATSGEEYIKQVIVEARNCESVVVAEIDESRLKTPTINVRPLAGCAEAPVNLKPTQDWQECQVADFSKIRLYIARIKYEIQTCKRKWKSSVQLPYIDDQKEWIELCCGNPDTGIKALSPTLDVVLALNQPMIEIILGYLVDFIEEKRIILIDLGRWVYVLLVALELPLNPDMCSCLRSLARVCSVIRANMTLPDEFQVTILNLLICLVARYFRQLDLADQ